MGTGFRCAPSASGRNDAPPLGCPGNPGQIGDRGSEVDETDGVVDSNRLLDAWRKVNDQRDPQGRLVDEDSVGLLSVIAEPLPVVGGHDDSGLIERGPQARQEPAQLVIDVGNLPVVGVEVGKRGRRGVVRVGVVEVDELKEGSRGVALLQLGQGGVHHLAGAPFRLVPRPEGVVVPVEAAIEAVGRVEGEGPDDRHRLVALAAERLGQGRDVVGESEQAVGADSVLRRIEAGEHRGVGGCGEGDRGVRLKEDRTLRGESIQGGGPRRLMAVGSHAIGPQGVDRDQQDVPGTCGGARISRAPDRHQRRPRRQQEQRRRQAPPRSSGSGH